MAERKRSIETDIFGFKVGQKLINSKKKGDANEREAAKWLLGWTGKRFIRTPSSGGRRLENASNFCGDVVCEDESFDFLFAVETKHLKNVAIRPELRSNSKVFTIWEQAKADADRAGRLPMLMLRLNGYPKGFYTIYVTAHPAKVLVDSGVKLVSAGKLKSGEFLYGFNSDDVLDKCPYQNLLIIKI